MATIYRDVEVEIDTDEIWKEVLDELSTEEIEEYLEERRVRKKTPVVCTLEVNPAKRNVLDLKNETCKNREKRNVLKISHTRHFKTIKAVQNGLLL